MKWIKFERVQSQRNVGTEENPVWEDILTPLALSYCEYNLEIAKTEAYNGEYEIIDDGIPEPEPTPSDAERIAELEEALAMILSGVTE